MTIQQLDFSFPFIVFGYGVVMTFVLNSPLLMKIADEKMPQPLVEQMRFHRTLAVISLVIGALWSLQNIWFQNL